MMVKLIMVTGDDGDIQEAEGNGDSVSDDCRGDYDGDSDYDNNDDDY